MTKILDKDVSATWLSFLPHSFLVFWKIQFWHYLLPTLTVGKASNGKNAKNLSLFSSLELHKDYQSYNFI